MAIEVTESVQRIEIEINSNPSDKPLIVVWTKTTVDDPHDNRLPMTTSAQKTLSAQTPVMDEDGLFTGAMEATDISGEDQLVQDIAAVVWA